ncbi:MAG: NADPH-dependent FMN reductase [Planctomycetota bacterium]|jgi:FMN reductase
MKTLILGCSLNPKSKSQLLAARLNKTLEARGAENTFFDLRTQDVPLCDGANQGAVDPALDGAIRESDAVCFCVPIYNFDVNAATKTLIELTGKAWTDKLVGFACAAGGAGSYMSVMALANSLMLDFRCMVLPRFVYAIYSDFADGQILNEDVNQRLDDLADDMLRVGGALKGAKA